MAAIEQESQDNKIMEMRASQATRQCKLQAGEEGVEALEEDRDTTEEGREGGVCGLLALSCPCTWVPAY